MNLQIIRHAYLPDATLGRLIVGPLVLWTLEEGWRRDPDGPGGQKRDGALRESCVEDGEYDLVPHSGSKHRNVWALVNPKLGVWHWQEDIPAGQKWGRFAVLIHVANSIADIEGCVGVGLRADPQRAYVYESGAAIAKLREILGTGERHRLTIRPIAGTSETL